MIYKNLLLFLQKFISNDFEQFKRILEEEIINSFLLSNENSKNNMNTPNNLDNCQNQIENKTPNKIEIQKQNQNQENKIQNQ